MTLEQMVNEVEVGGTVPVEFHVIPHVKVQKAMEISPWDAEGEVVECKVLAIVDGLYLMQVEPNEVTDEPEACEFVDDFGLRVAFALTRDQIGNAIKAVNPPEFFKTA